MTQAQQSQPMFNLTNLSGDEVNTIMGSLDEQPAKVSRNIMNKLEGQLIQQAQAFQAAQQSAAQDPNAPLAPPVPLNPSTT